MLEIDTRIEAQRFEAHAQRENQRSSLLETHIKQQTKLDVAKFEGFEKLCLAQDSLALVEYAMGLQGPSTFFNEQRPLTNKSVMAINDSFGIHAALDPHLRQAPGLVPEVSIQDDRINPYPSRAILMIVILAFLGWTIWLLLRPEKPEDH
mgnify:CR=1 FL=1